jgi:hypothetical protein
VDPCAPALEQCRSLERLEASCRGPVGPTVRAG